PLRALPLAALLLANLVAIPHATQSFAAGPAVPAATAPDSTVEWSVAPADAAGEDGRIPLRHVVDPGATIADNIAITNHGSAASTFTVQAGDGVVGANGAFDIAEGTAEGSGAWIRIDGLDAGALTLAAGETRVLPVTVAVPANATPGDHPAGIVVGVSKGEDGVTVTHRIGVRVHLQVAGELAASLAVTDTHATFAPSW